MESNSSSTSRVMQKYIPTSFLSDNLNTNGRGRASSLSSGAVSVSGLALSKDLRELLVSYENDQVSILCFKIDNRWVFSILLRVEY